MANLIELEQWEEGIYQLETDDPVLGGEDGIDNLQAKQLGNRTKWLKAQLLLRALIDSPEFTGTPKVPTAAPGTNNTQAASTAFTKAAIDAAIAALVDSSPGALDTLNELAAALGDDPNFATTITNALALKAPWSTIDEVITEAGMIPDHGVLTQLRDAIQAMIAGSLTSEVALQGAFRNLTGSASGLDADVDYVVDEIVLGDGSGNYAVARNVTETITMSTSGAGGLDTGAVAASTWYYGYIIGKDDGTVAALASLSASSPTLPAGYTKWARVGSFRTDATANKYPLSFIQAGARINYKVVAGSNVANLPNMAAGVAGNPTTPTWVAVSVANFIPITAATIHGSIAAPGAAAVVVVAAPNNNYGGYTDGSNVVPVSINSQSPSLVSAQIFSFALESSNIYWAATTAAARIICYGWDEKL